MISCTPSKNKPTNEFDLKECFDGNEYSFRRLRLENNYAKYLIEKRSKLHTFLIPGNEIGEIIPYLDYERTKVFSKLAECAPQISDLDGLDQYYNHMLVIDPLNNNLIGAQRLRFNFIDKNYNEKHSYLEQSNVGIHNKLVSLKRDYAEIGRTFVTSNYRNKLWLKELIRGFIRIPEAFGIKYAYGMVSFNHLIFSEKTTNNFINCLEKSSFVGDLELFTKNKYSDNISIDWDLINLKSLESKLQQIDVNFNIPTVLYLYRLYCNVNYECFSIAKSYNKIMQLLFSGNLSNLNSQCCKRLKKYHINTNTPIYIDN